ncbi:MAG: PDZ domain-containing protein [Candidatus Obscuribacterales bacterium]|nr:PDZ domain-containing protein [Candidatus Obscuribacterales bacterium]
MRVYSAILIIGLFHVQLAMAQTFDLRAERNGSLDTAIQGQGSRSQVTESFGSYRSGSLDNNSSRLPQQGNADASMLYDSVHQRFPLSADENSNRWVLEGKEERAPAQKHGQTPIGVLGIKINLATAEVMLVFPQSDANRQGVNPGDQVIEVNGKAYNPATFQRLVRGVPGTTVQIRFRRGLQTKTFQLMRIDARAVAQYGDYYSFWASRTRFW